jgi:hypothetical protein
VIMKAFGMDSGGWPVAPGSESSHYARHGLSRPAFIGGAAAAAAGPSLGSALLWPVSASAWSAENALGFSFKSDPSGTTSVFGQLGCVRNGFSPIENGDAVIASRRPLDGRQKRRARSTR